MTSTLEITGLTVEAGGKEILHGIDLTVSSGEVHVVMGPNGSGKSTLAHALMGRPGVEVTGGRALLDGEDLLALPTWQRARAGLFLAHQQPVELPGIDLPSLMAEGSCGAEGEPPASLLEAAAALRFDERLVARGVNVDLSGGEQKRSETLQLVMLRPRFAVLDEIDSGLDVDALGQVARRIEAATTQWGLGVVAVTHFPRLLVELAADRVHVLVGGRIVADGGPELARELEASGYAGFL